MAEPVTVPIRGVDRATPAAQAEPGTCRAIENLVATSPDEGVRWAVPRSPTQMGGNEGLGQESIGQHSEGRLIYVDSSTVKVVDPTFNYNVTNVWTLPTGVGSSAAKAKFARVGDSTFVAITIGDDSDRYRQLLEVKDTNAEEVQWPPLPLISVEADRKQVDIFEDTYDALPPGPFAFRFAWQLKDGTLSAASPPVWINPDLGAWQARFTVDRLPVDRTPKELPQMWENRIDRLAVIAHPPVLTQEGEFRNRVTTLPEKQPGYIIKRVKTFDAGDTWTYSAPIEDILASEPYDGIGLKAHQVRGGEVYGYNERLIVGDASYDLQRPRIKKHIKWKDGRENGGGDDYFVVMRVTVDTKRGKVQRFSKLLPFDSISIQNVVFRNGHVTYPDSRAVSYDFFAKQGVTGAWKRPSMIGANREFQDVPGSSFSYDGIGTGPFDFSNRSGRTLDLFQDREWVRAIREDSMWNGSGDDYRVRVRATDDAGDLTTESDFKTRAFRFDEIFPDNDEDIASFQCDIYLHAKVTSSATSTANSGADAEIEIRTQDGTVLASAKKDVFQGGTGDTDNTFTISFSRANVGAWDPGDAYDIRVELDVSASAETSGSTTNRAEAAARVYNSQLEVDKPQDNTDYGLTIPNEKNDVNPARIIWSETTRPIDFRAENVVYAGEHEVVQAMQATGQEVSGGQFGDYPILLFTNKSVRIMQVGTDPFIEGVQLITADAGVVNPKCVTSADGSVVAALETGVYVFTPQMQTPALSEPLHDPSEKWLTALNANPGSSPSERRAVHYHKGDEQNRHEVWVAHSERIWVYSFNAGAWSQLPRQRGDFLNYRGQTGRREAQIGMGPEVYNEVGGTSDLDFTVITSPLHLGEEGRMERIYEMWCRTAPAVEQLGMNLVALDPDEANNAGANEQTRATMPDGYLAEDLLPHVYLKGKGQNKPHQAVLRFAEAYGYAWFAIIGGTGSAPNEAISEIGFEVEPRRRAQAPFAYNAAKP